MTGRVFVVDDIEQNVKLLEAKLTNEFYTVFTASSGIECLEKVKEIAPDIILLDVMMPEMDGFETCRRLRADPETSQIPVVMVTALSEVSDRVQGLTAGADDFITKPIDEVHLFARVKSLIRLKMMMDELKMRDKTGAQLGIVEEKANKEEESITGSIMVVDDDIAQIKKTQEALTGSGHTAEAVDAANAVSTATEKDFDLIIISASVEDDTGIRLGMQIKSQEKNRHTPVMIMVEEEEKPQLFKALEAGIDDYVMLPIEVNELLARVKTQIRRKKFQDALKQSYEESLSAAVVDGLTKLYNRRYLDTHLGNIMKETLEKKGDLSLFTIDIDHFKAVNDRPGWGHDVGDQVLIEVAKRIKSSLRTTDLATRPGGEEFIIVLPSTDLRDAAMVAERVRRCIEGTPFKISAEPGTLDSSVSIGVSSLKKEGDTQEELIKRSDNALYQAKDTGRNKVVVARAVNAGQ